MIVTDILETSNPALCQEWSVNYEAETNVHMIICPWFVQGFHPCAEIQVALD